MILSKHAIEEMQNDCISEQEVEQCLQHGEHEITQIVDGEKRYGKKLQLNDKTIMVIYTIQNNEDKIITTYIIKRKKDWSKK